MTHSIMPVVYCSVKLLASCCLLLSILSGAAHAFGGKAHRVAGFVAEANLCPASDTEVAKLLPDSNLAEAGLWADRIRSDPAWDIAQPWHYINVPDDVSVATSRHSGKGDIILAINYFRYQLADSQLSVAKQRIALYMLVHFIVDIHQPLHVGRKQDLGGNLVRVRTGEYRGNLHSYWDSQVFNFVDDLPAYARQLREQYAAESLQWSPAVPVRWAAESQQLRDTVYAFGYDADGLGLLQSDYQHRARGIAARRLAQAGNRLAAVLNDIWCR